MNKGMPFWEQHLEKMVLGLTLLLLLGVFAMMVLGTSEISAEIDGRKYGPAEVDEVMVAKARELGIKLEPDASADVATLEAVDGSGAGRFAMRLAEGVSPSRPLPRTSPALASVLLPEDIGAVDVWYFEPSLPAPVMRPTIAQTVDTIDPSEFDRVPELSSLVAGNGDVVWTTPVAVMDLASLRRELDTEAMSADPSRHRIPSNWFNERPYVVDVVFERQMAMDDGGWSEPEIVDLLPGSFELRSEIQNARDNDELNAGFKESVWDYLDDRVDQVELVQPEFYATLNDRLSIGDTLLAATPEAVEEEPVDDAEASRRQQEKQLRRRIKDRVNAASRLEATLTELGGPVQEEDDIDSGSGSSRGSSRGGGGGNNPNGGAPGFGSEAGRRGGPTSDEDRKRRRSMTLKLERMQEDIARLQAQLAELNPEVEVEIELDPDALIPDFAEVDEVLVWAHDLAVQPGETYRYRCHLVVFNPFFARGRQLLPQQQPLAEDFEMDTATSPWSNPVTIAPPVEFFVVQANDGAGSMGLGEARVELYTYSNGSVRSEQFTVQPGERIGRTVNIAGDAVDFTTDWYLVDVISDPAAPEASGLDRDDNATVICRRIDGAEIRIQLPSRQRSDTKRVDLRIDTEGSADQG